MSSGERVWLITGCSTGFGRELTRQLLSRGQRVVATARNPAALDEFASHPGALVALLDVTVPEQIKAAVALAVTQFGGIDVLVNNAGYGYLAALEEGEDEEVRAMFETNVFGLVNMTKAVLPGMRDRRSGHIVNISSMGGLIGFPGIGYYNASKFAVEGLSEALAKEVEPLGIRVRLVEPGMIKTDFGGRSFDFAMEERLSDYASTVEAMGRLFGKLASDPSPPEVVAEVVWAAANEAGDTLRYRAGADAQRLLDDRKVQDDAAFIGSLKALMNG